MYIIDRIEHGNMGVCGSTILDKLPLKEALKKKPSDYGIHDKWWGFWPVISKHKDGVNDYSYYWDDDELRWVKTDRKEK